MTKHGIIGLSISAVAVITGLTFYTDYAFNQQIKNMISQDNQGTVQITLESEKQALLNGVAQYKIIIPSEAIQQFAPQIPSPESIELYVNHSHSTLPLFITSDITLDLTKGSLKELLIAYPEQNIEHLLTVNTNLLFQSNSTNLVIKPTVFKGSEGTISTGDIVMNSQTDFSFTSGDFQGKFETLNIDLGSQGQFSLSGLASEFSINIVDGMLLTPHSDFLLNEMNFTSDARGVEMKMKDLNITSHYNNIDSDVLSGNSMMSIASFNFNDNNAAYDVLNTTLDMTINNIDKAGLIAIDKASKNGSNPDEMMDAVGLILTRGVDGRIDKLNTTVNKLDIKTSGDFTLSPYTGDNLQRELQQHVMTKFNVNYNASLGNNYADSFPHYAPIVDMMIGQEFMTKDDAGRVSTVIKIENGTILANGKRVR